jgi:predicted metal-dependent RNase
MSLSGHSSEAQFRKYLKADNFQNANIVLKHWENNNNVEQFAEK